jgi:hypothetical protein
VISGVLFPAALFSFTLLLYDFHKGEVGIGKKYAELAYFSAISGIFLGGKTCCAFDYNT